MTSRLAKGQIELWKREGLEPSFEDVVLLNGLGLAVERGSDMFSFSACPRIAFLGDNILREPTVAKRIWIDEAQRLFADTVESKVYVLAYALGTSDDELPGLNDAKKIQAGIVKYRDDVLLRCTETQILAAIDYVLNGNKPDLTLPPDAADAEKAEAKKLEDVYDVPCGD